MRVPIALVILLVAIVAAGESRDLQEASIADFPAVVALLRTVNYVTRLTACGGAILNNRSVLSAARCFEYDAAERWRFRVGSSQWNSSGVVYAVSEIIRHEDWDEWAMMTDIAIVRTNVAIAESANVRPGNFASYAVPLNSEVLTVGWGYVSMPLWAPTEYQDLQKFTLTNLDIEICRPYYYASGLGLRNNQLCTGFSEPESSETRNKCFGEPGMPLFHGSNIVGIRSYSLGCNYEAEIPSINTHIGSFIDWIQDNA